MKTLRLLNKTKCIPINGTFFTDDKLRKSEKKQQFVRSVQFVQSVHLI